jgi:hypothetical protein
VVNAGGVQHIGNLAVGPNARAISGQVNVGPAPSTDIAQLLARFERLLAEHESALPEPEATTREVRRLREELDEDKPEPTVVRRALDRITAFVQPVAPLAVAAAQLVQAIQGHG